MSETSKRKSTPPKKRNTMLPRPTPAEPPETPKSGERIAKVMARAGLASRREAEQWIADKRVAVNGEVITSPALNISAKDRVSVDGKPLPMRERTRLFLYNKPRGLLTTRNDPQGRPTIFDGLPDDLPRLISIGRLDLNTEGLLLLTNDGGLARVLELPETGWLRRYRVRAYGRVTQQQLDTLRDGVEVEGVRYGAIEATLDREQGHNVWLTFAMREGKNREVKNVLGHLGVDVNRLIRVSFGPFQLGELKDGEIEEVKARVLREQIGERLSAISGADFSTPQMDRRKAVDAADRPALAPAAQKFEPARRTPRQSAEGRSRETTKPRQHSRDAPPSRPASAARFETRSEKDPQSRPQRDKGGLRPGKFARPQTSRRKDPDARSDGPPARGGKAEQSRGARSKPFHARSEERGKPRQRDRDTPPSRSGVSTSPREKGRGRNARPPDRGDRTKARRSVLSLPPKKPR
jgi:23S rRNA pseudouridine2605 synthase